MGQRVVHGHVGRHARRVFRPRSAKSPEVAATLPSRRVTPRTRRPPRPGSASPRGSATAPRPAARAGWRSHRGCSATRRFPIDPRLRPESEAPAPPFVALLQRRCCTRPRSRGWSRAHPVFGLSPEALADHEALLVALPGRSPGPPAAPRPSPTRCQTSPRPASSSTASNSAARLASSCVVASWNKPCLRATSAERGLRPSPASPHRPARPPRRGPRASSSPARDHSPTSCRTFASLSMRLDRARPSRSGTSRSRYSIAAAFA